MSIDLTYPAIVDLIGGRGMTEKQQSRQLLAWFLQNYYHFTETEAQDCICDERFDKGVDGLYVDRHLRRVDVFSSVLTTKERSVGDVSPKEFQGALAQFQSSTSVRQLEIDTQNRGLKRILRDQEVANRLDDGFTVHGVYVSNKKRDPETTQYLQHTPHITLWDSIKLENEYVALNRTPPISTPITFDISDVPSMEYKLDAELSMIIAPIAAKELVNLEGIVNQKLFAPNVRFWLGKNTTVNKALADSIKESSEHKYFPAFHNGLIILCEKLKRTKKTIKIENYAVVNGCQSLRGLYDNRDSITPALKIITKFFQLSTDSKLAVEITNRTNNQNGIKNRDLQSNTDIQTRLQSEMHAKYPDEFYYRISRGENPEWPKEKVIENEFAGQLLLAFDLKEPDKVHVNTNIFTDEGHAKIFGRREVNADRIIALYTLHDSILEKRVNIANEPFGLYILTRFLLLTLMREVLETDTTGKAFYEDPSKFLAEQNGRSRLKTCSDIMAGNLCRFLVMILIGVARIQSLNIKLN